MAKGNAGAKEGGGHGRHGSGDMSSDATRPQLAALAGVTLFMLATGMIVPGFSVNLRLSVKDVGGTIMPPGMIMPFDTPAETMREMSAVRPREVSYRAPADARGDRLLEPRIENGVKVYDIEASVIRWNILPDVAVDAYAYNRQVPGPRLQVTEGDHVRINFRNRLPESSTVHWHGFILPDEMDGPGQHYAEEPGPTGQNLDLRVHGRPIGNVFLPQPRPLRPPTGARTLRRADYRSQRSGARTSRRS